MKKAIASVCLFGMVVASVLAADIMEFRKVDYFEVVTKDNENQTRRNAMHVWRSTRTRS